MIQLVADGFIIIIIVVGAYTLLKYVPRPKIAAYKYGAMAGLTSFVIAKFISVLYQPASERPFELMGREAGALYFDNPGFPSDHALFATVITLAVFALTGRRKTAMVLAALTLAVCIGRVVALVHTPLDVIGGIICGLVGAVWYLSRPKK